VVLLLVVQTLGLVHRTVHPQGPVPTVGASAEHGLLGHHSSAECRLLDQLAPTDLAPLPALAVAFAAPVQAVAHTVQRTAPPARERAYRARDPPAFLA
jgi:hypothetical protein